MSNPRIPIGIAVVEHAGKYLVGRRAPTASLPGRDEFPGGKCEPGESPRDCAVRECLEETGLRVEPLELLLSVPFNYDHAKVELFFWRCRLIDATRAGNLPDKCRWVPLNELSGLNFPKANAPLLELLFSRA
ncbi:MAG: (deoxy)nucleoside triphosphate pyrophosphohydrolase [Planctomycetaceae bacterium]